MSRAACSSRLAAAAALLTLLSGVPAWAAEGASSKSQGGLLPGARSKDPVSIDAAKLDYFDKDAKLIYTGEVVARQGDTTLKASVLTIFLVKTAKKDGEAPAEAGPGTSSSIQRMEAKGPVTVISKDEVGTGDSGTYDKAENKIVLTGNVTLTQATNVIRGDKLVYDMTSGQAQVSSGQTAGRVRSVFTPGSGNGASTPRKNKPDPAPGPARKPGANP